MLPKACKLDNDEGDKDENKKRGWQEVKQGGRGKKIEEDMARGLRMKRAKRKRR